MAKDSKKCKVVSCENPIHKRGWCSAHYQRWLKNGDLKENIPTGRTIIEGQCDEPGCERPMVCKRLCTLHYNRLKTKGHTGPTGKIYTGKGHINAQGYRRIPVGGGRELAEHRVVMERHLGRPLKKNETIHHLNGIRHDNRLENLELRASHHGKGQRPADLVDWIVRDYPEMVREALAALDSKR